MDQLYFYTENFNDKLFDVQSDMNIDNILNDIIHDMNINNIIHDTTFFDDNFYDFDCDYNPLDDYIDLDKFDETIPKSQESNEELKSQEISQETKPKELSFDEIAELFVGYHRHKDKHYYNNVLNKWKKKRNKLTFKNKVLYESRSKFAKIRQRVNGRFVNSKVKTKTKQ
jgi:hypothetical protein